MSLKKIAEKANVSVMTVSRVLNCRGHVSPETRRRVLAVSRELGVFPKGRGRRSARRAAGRDRERHDTVAILIDTAYSGVFLSEVIVAIQRALREHEFQCMVQSYSGEYVDFLRAIANIRPEHATACLAVGHYTRDEIHGIIGANSRCVFVDYVPGPEVDVPINVVSYDNVTAAQMAVRELVACGCRRVVCLQGFPNHHFSRAMREGFLSVTGQESFENGQLLTGDFTSGGGYRVMRGALARGVALDGLFTTDEMAFGAIRALKESGRRIPDDVKVMGCDGIELGRELHPPLSTVVLDRPSLCRRAVRRLIEVLDAKEPTYERVLLCPKLEMRGTCPGGSREVTVPANERKEVKAIAE